MALLEGVSVALRCIQGCVINDFYESKEIYQGGMMRNICLIVLTMMISSCTTVQFVSPYDAVIDNGLTDYKESINTLAKNLADSAGTKEGTFEENREKYNALESKIDLLIDRAVIQSSGHGCKLTTNVAAKVAEVMTDGLVQKMDANEKGDSYGCTEWLLTLVKTQLGTIQNIHENTDKCKLVSDSNKRVSCLRPATSETAMKITNQSINAAWVVETAKKSEGGE